MVQFPQGFADRMKALLGDEYEAFAASYEKPYRRALRVNPLKITRDEFLKLSPFLLEPVPWEPNGFYYGEEDRPGRHPYHDAGLYYMQEPSAMAVAALAFYDGVPGSEGAPQHVLDLCAAPGGKSTQLAGYMMGEGLLVSNEYDAQRAKILSQNIERMGATNVIVTNEVTDALAARFGSFFDRIVVDAPCSGEGMFRKEEQAVTMWSEDNIRLCAERQAFILEQAAAMLRFGGVLVYSTCTFAPEEDEESVARFLTLHPEFEPVNLWETMGDRFAAWGFSKGNPSWCRGVLADGTVIPNTVRASLDQTIRLFPHRLDGEGHFMTVLRKVDRR